MKTIPQLKKERQLLVDENDAILGKRTYKKSELSRLKKIETQCAFIDMCIKYLEHENINEDVIRAHLRTERNKLSVINDRWPVFTSHNTKRFNDDTKKMRSEFNKLHNVTRINKYIKTLTYILS